MNNNNWTRLLDKGLNFEGTTNTNYPFPRMSKDFGLEFIEYLRAAYLAKDELTDEEFCKINGDVPRGFLEKKVKN